MPPGFVTRRFFCALSLGSYLEVSGRGDWKIRRSSTGPQGDRLAEARVPVVRRDLKEAGSEALGPDEQGPHMRPQDEGPKEPEVDAAGTSVKAGAPTLGGSSAIWWAEIPAL